MLIIFDVFLHVGNLYQACCSSLAASPFPMCDPDCDPVLETLTKQCCAAQNANIVLVPSSSLLPLPSQFSFSVKEAHDALFPHRIAAAAPSTLSRSDDFADSDASKLQV